MGVIRYGSFVVTQSDQKIGKGRVWVNELLCVIWKHLIINGKGFIQVFYDFIAITFPEESVCQIVSAQ